MFRERPSLVLVDGMLSVRSRGTLDCDLSLFGFEAVGNALLQQAVKLDPILDFDLSAGVDRRGFESLPSLIIGRLARLLNGMNDGRLVERPLVFYVDLPDRRHLSLHIRAEMTGTHLNLLIRSNTSSCWNWGYFLASRMACMLRYEEVYKRSQTNRADLCGMLLQTAYRERCQSAGMTFTCARDAQHARVRPLQYAHAASRRRTETAFEERRTSTVEDNTCLQYLYRGLTLQALWVSDRASRLFGTSP